MVELNHHDDITAHTAHTDDDDDDARAIIIMRLAVAVIACTLALAASSVVRTTHAKPLSDDAFVGDDAPRYVIRLPKERPDVSPVTPHRRVRMTAADGKRYVCVVPMSTREVEGDEDGDGERGGLVGERADASFAEMIEEDASPGTATDVNEHLKPLSNRCFYYSNGDWWTYEVCHEKKVEQFHREGTTRVNSHSLGTFDAEATAALAETNRAKDSEFSSGSGIGFAGIGDDGEQRYHAHSFTNGTECAGPDVGSAFEDARRSSEVRFVCSEDGSEGISGVDEPATCTYVLTFRTPYACKAKDLRPKHPNVENIVCTLADDEDGDRVTTAGIHHGASAVDAHDEL